MHIGNLGPDGQSPFCSGHYYWYFYYTDEKPRPGGAQGRIGATLGPSATLTLLTLEWLFTTWLLRIYVHFHIYKLYILHLLCISYILQYF